MWQNFLDHPAFQSGITPFVAAASVVAGTYRTRWPGLCVGAGLLVLVVLAGGFAFEPLTVSRRLIVLAFAASVAGAFYDFKAKPVRWFTHFCPVLTAIGAVWIVAPVLLRQESLAQAAASAIGAALFLSTLTLLVNSRRTDSLRAGAAGLALGAGSGGAAVLGASIYLGELGIALSAACGAYLLVQLIGGRRIACGATFTLPVVVLSGGIGLAAVFVAQLPWVALLLLAPLPGAAAISFGQSLSVRRELMLVSLTAVVAAVVALILIWGTVGGSV